MTRDDILTGVLLEDVALSVEELAQACACEPRWVIEHIESGLLECIVVTPGERRFASAEFVRARRLRALERDFDANAELAALTVDLIEEVESLRRQLRAVRRAD
jgi:chaperone modulatory protein CbpM